ncbi:MAG TPA: hypothetical protein VIF12_04760 [Micavibrio sp.]
MGTGFTYEQFNALVRQPAVAREDSYLNAPLYYILTGRKGIWVHEGYGSAMAVCRHPHIDDRLLVFPEVGHAEGKLAASVLSGLELPPGGVQLARFTAYNLESLKDALSQQNSSRIDSIKVIQEEILDWRYPAHMLDTARVARVEGHEFAKIRNKCRKVKSTTEILDLQDPAALRAMRAAHKYWEGSMVLRDRDGSDSNGYYTTLFAMIEEWPHLFNGLVFMQGKRPLGFTVCDTPFMKKANLLANLSDATVAGLADYQVVATCRTMAAKGVIALNFGGSETESLDLFKRKFVPSASIELMSADIIYHAGKDGNVRSGALLSKFTMT